MENDQTPVKMIVKSIEEYYSGKQLKQICDEHEIEQEVFHNWLAEYKHLVIEIMELRIENERLRKIFVDLSLKHQSLSNGKDQESSVKI